MKSALLGENMEEGKPVKNYYSKVWFKGINDRNFD
jgi:hypothetical protein